MLDGVDLLRRAPDGADDPLAMASFPLVPYANRIAQGRFAFDGADHQLPRNFGDHPHSIHGFGWQASWTAKATGADHVLLVHDRQTGRIVNNESPEILRMLNTVFDAFATRQRINRAAWAAGVPLVSASALRWDGQISVFDPRQPDSPCYACLFPPDAPPEETRCALLGVFAPVVGLMGVMQAGEALKLLAGLGDDAAVDTLGGHISLAGRLLMLDGRDWSWTRLRVKRDPACPVCGAAACAEGST